ncbi:MAG: endonuclease/exonuclease/phosphatase family protein [Clostridia bacterium]|nr:endonuclease/exonuclease/phosphatase family protein [Clostridia bacterium]
MKAKKIIKISCIVLACLIGLFAVLVGGYVAYVAAQYSRIGDWLELEIADGRENSVRCGTEYSLLSYNLGFGAYSPEYSFFMDTGVMNDGKTVTGIYAKGMNRADVEKNVTGQLRVASEIDADFCFFQEVDENADRSYHIDMLARARQVFAGYCSAYAENFHTAYLLYPFNDPIGKSNAGILTLSRYKIESAVRRAFPVTTAFPDKFFDLDRCFSVQYLPVADSVAELVLINLHMSAYDEGGAIRAKQLEMLNGVLKEERDKGNYVIAGGDFNHCLIADRFESEEEALQYFKSEQKTPDWVKNSVLREAELTEGFRIAANTNVATCRGADIPYREGVNYSTVVDGFLVSDNVTVIEEKTIDTQYAYSDHNPVLLRFELH